MRRPYKAAVIGGGLQKALTLGDLDEFMDWAVNQGEGGATPQELYKAVAWTFWSVNLRADSVSKTPYLIYPMDVEKDEPDKEVEWGVDLRPILWPIEAWICLMGAAYVLKHVQGSTLEKLQVLNANTMSVKTWDQYGDPLTFEQKFGTQRRTFSADELLYFRTFDPRGDIREGTASGQVGRRPGALVHAVNQWGEAFFENGAIPAVLLTTEGTVPLKEKGRIESAWNKLLRGVRQQFKTVVLERGLTPTVIGQPPKDLAMPEMEEAKRRQILAAHKIPFGLAEPSTNRAEQDALQVRLWTDCIIPEIETWIEPVLNEQLFNPLGLRVSFQYDQIEALQMRELEKSESSAFLISIIKGAYEGNAASLEEYRAWIERIGGWSNMPPLDENFTPEERTPPQLQPFTGQQPADDEAAEDEPPTAEERIESRLPKAILSDLGRWERKAITRIREGNPAKALEFASDAIPAVMHRMIIHSLEHAVTMGDVVEVFRSARGESKQIHFIPEGQGDPLPPVPNEVTISEADIDRAIKDWNKHLPDFVGLLDAEVIHRENYDDA